VSIHRRPLPRHRTLWALDHLLGPLLVSTDCKWRARVVPLPTSTVVEHVYGHELELELVCHDCGLRVEVRPMPDWMRDQLQREDPPDVVGDPRLLGSSSDLRPSGA